MTPTERRPEINMSGIPVRGVGGLGLVVLAAVMTIVMPEAWWLIVAGATGGVLLGAALIVFHRFHRASGPSGSDPTILFRAPAVAQRRRAGSDRSANSDARLAISS